MSRLQCRACARMYLICTPKVQCLAYRIRAKIFRQTIRSVLYSTVRYCTGYMLCNATPNSPGTPAVALRSCRMSRLMKPFVKIETQHIAHRRLTAHSENLFRSRILPTLQLSSAVLRDHLSKPPQQHRGSRAMLSPAIVISSKEFSP